MPDARLQRTRASYQPEGLQPMREPIVPGGVVIHDHGFDQSCTSACRTFPLEVPSLLISPPIVDATPTARDRELGIALRFIRGYDPAVDQMPTQRDAETYRLMIAQYQPSSQADGASE